MLNASVGFQRVIGRVRRSSIDSMTAMTIPTRPRVSSRAARVRYRSQATSIHLYPRPRRRRRSIALPSLALDRSSLWTVAKGLRRAIVGLGHERIVAVAAAGILLSASFLSVSPGRAGGDTGGPSGDGPTPRLAIAGAGDGDHVGSVEEAYVTQSDRGTEGATDGTVAHRDLEPAKLDAYRMNDDTMNRAGVAAALAAQEQTVEGPFLDDGTLLKPVAVDTTVPDGSDLMQTYRVKSGDTLATIADRFNVTTMTLWWANDLKAKNRLVVGQRLRVPPVSGLVVEVTPLDTLAGLANRYKISEQDILSTNGLDDRNLVVGQVLMLPGARGAGIVVPKPRKTATVSTPSRIPRSGGTTTVRPPRTYSGGNMAWPTASRHISQYFHYGHYGLDIDGSTGDPIFAGASGTVIFAGWKNNGGGYQVWVAHGSGLHTTYNHMSSVSVGRGQHVGKGQRVGRMGSTGFATGSHLHFEVWKGRVWDGGSRVNPLAYL